MAKHTGPFQILLRRDTGGKPMFCVRFHGEDGKLHSWQSTGQTSRSAARAWAAQETGNGPIPAAEVPTFGKYAENWWTPECSYCRRQRVRGRSVSPSYADVQRIYLKRHILPTFGKMKIAMITPWIIEEWVLKLRETPSVNGNPLSPTTVNHCLTTLKTMLKEAAWQGIIPSNPAALIERLRETPKGKQILTVEEARTLFLEDRIDGTWDGNVRQFTLNLLAASTGLRMGEAQALQVQHVHPDHVAIVHAWARKYGMKDPKWKSSRVIPIASKTARYLTRVIEASPCRQPEDLVFWGKDARTPIPHRAILNALYAALGRIGICPAERTKRNVTFHSWRHFFNTVCRTRIPDYKLQRLTGHRTQEMTEHYTHLSLEDFKDVVTLQEEVLG